MDKVVLREYLEKVRRLENDIYTMDQAMIALERNKKGPAIPHQIAPPQRQYIPEPKREDFKKNKLSGSSALGAGAGALMFGPLGLVAGYAIGKAASKKSSEYDAAMEQYRIQLEESERQYQEQLRQHQHALLDEEARCAKEQEHIARYNQNVDYQISSVRQLRNATKQVLQKLYDVGIIYIKYRSLIPVSRFCEYLDSGRRTELEGTNGMYDLYEAELASKQIVNGLHTVNENLGTISNQIGFLSYQMNSIQQNQELLYREISQSNTLAQEICHELKSIAERQEQHYGIVEESAKMTAFNAAITARNSEALADIAKYEHAKNNSWMSDFGI